MMRTDAASTRVIAAGLLCLLASCDGAPQRPALLELSGSAMGTTWSLKTVAAPLTLNPAVLQREAQQALAVVEQQMSTYIADSELSRFNAYRSTDWFQVSLDLCRVVTEALTLSVASDGAFDITVGPLVNVWGFGPDGAATKPPDASLIQLLLDNVGYTALHADCAMPALRKDCPDVYVDLSAIAKGYAVDRLAELLDTKQVLNYLVEIGGELRARGRNVKGVKWAIAIESPDRSGRSVQSIIALTDAAMATSGDYRNYFEYEGSMYSHTIDPRKGYPVTHAAASVTVIADTAEYADAMATALLVLGPDTGLDFAERENIAAYYLLRQDGRISARSSSLFAAKAGLR